jgi:hypothetical protein
MFWSPPLRQPVRHWWDTRTAKRYEFSDPVFRILVRHMFPTIGEEPANDRDHCKW